MDEALTDVLRLSRGMTYKAAAAGLNLGGGKAVIIGDPKQGQERGAVPQLRPVRRVARRPLHHRRGRRHRHGGHGDHPHRDPLGHRRLALAYGGGGDPSPVTAFGVLQGMKAAATGRFGDERSLAGRSVAIQGLGNVGYHLATYLKEEGAKIFAADIDADAHRAARRELGAEIVPADEILSVDCDVFAPCALGAMLNDDDHPAAALQDRRGRRQQPARRRGARRPRLCTSAGILYAPDYVINAGGLINVYNELTGYNRERALHMARGIYANMIRVFEISRAESIPTACAADRVAEERIGRIQGMRARHWVRAIRQPRNHA